MAAEKAAAAPAARQPADACRRPVAHQRHAMAAAAPPSLRQEREQEREQLIEQLSKEKQELQVQPKDCRSQCEATDSENGRLVFQLKEATAALEAERQKIADLATQVRSTAQQKLALEKRNADNEDLLDKQFAYFGGLITRLTNSATELKQEQDDLIQCIMEF